MAAAIGCLGAALLPIYLIEDELRSGVLAPLHDLPMSTENAYYVVRPETKQTHDAAVTFQERLLSQVG